MRLFQRPLRCNASMNEAFPANQGISLIAAVSNNGVIGIENKLPWHIPTDLQFFKKVTLRKPVIMGRKTYDSIGRPLPGRLNLIVTRDRNFAPAGVSVMHSLEDAIKVGREQAAEVMVIGGAEIYRQALPVANNLYLTEVNIDINGDAYFPSYDKNEWKLVWEEQHPQTEANPQAFRFVCYQR